MILIPEAAKKQEAPKVGKALAETAATALAQLGISVKNANDSINLFRQQLQELRTVMNGLSNTEKDDIKASALWG